jgi:SM-20-related protein
MTEQPTLINLDALRAAPLTESPFPFVVVPHFLRADCADAVTRDFPDIRFRGSFPSDTLACGGTFARLIAELKSTDLRAAIEEKFSLTLADRHTLVTVRGMAHKRDGRIHADTRSKFLTLLLYLNPEWQAGGGRLRLLRNRHDLSDYVVEVPPTFGSCLLFKVTDNCWHGHEPFAGVRRVLQLNYIRDEAALGRHQLRHRMSAKLKQFSQRLMKSGSSS